MLAFASARVAIRKRSRFGVLMLLFYFFSGITLTAGLTESNFPDHIVHHQAEKLLCRVEDAPKERPRSYRIAVRALATEKEGKWQKASGKYWVYLSKEKYEENPLGYGDVFLHVNRVTWLSDSDTSFAVKLQLARQYYGRCFLKDWIKCGRAETDFDLKGLTLQARQWVCSTLQGQMNFSKESAIAVALLVGEEIDIDDTISDAYAATGTLHVLAVSGMHVGLIYMLLRVCFSLLLKRKWGPWLYYPVVLVLVWMFTLVAGAAPSIVRAATMCSIMLAAQWSDRRNQGFGALGASLFLMLLPNPWQLYEPGLQLSFCAVLGIVWLQKSIRLWVEPPNRVLFWIWELTSVSVAAQIMTLPVSLFYFGQFPNYFLLANLVVIPLTTMSVYIGIAQLLSSAFEVLSLPLAWLNRSLIWLSDEIVLEIQRWPGALTSIHIDLAECCFLFIFICCMEAWLRTRTFRYALMGLGCLLATTIYVFFRTMG
jgi:competence protein ComEC